MLRQRIRACGVTLEVCPLSNQVLKLIHDLRNHPLSLFVAEGLPVTINPDDPALWGATGVTFDWVQALLSTGNSTGLGELKSFALNSLLHSSASDQEKARDIALWQTAWSSYVEWLAQQQL